MSALAHIQERLVSLYGQVEKEEHEEGVSFRLAKSVSCALLSSQIEQLLSTPLTELSITSSESETSIFIKV
jgi:hypothetical protein